MCFEGGNNRICGSSIWHEVRVEREESLACTTGRIVMFINIRKTGEKQVWWENQEFNFRHVKSELPFSHTNRSQAGSWMLESGVRVRGDV